MRCNIPSQSLDVQEDYYLIWSFCSHSICSSNQVIDRLLHFSRCSHRICRKSLYISLIVCFILDHQLRNLGGRKIKELKELQEKEKQGNVHYYIPVIYVYFIKHMVWYKNGWTKQRKAKRNSEKLNKRKIPSRESRYIYFIIFVKKKYSNWDKRQNNIMVFHGGQC